MTKTEQERSQESRGGTMAMVFLALYLASPVPVAFVLDRTGLDSAGTRDLFQYVYAPVLFLIHHSPAVERFYRWQSEAVGIK